MFEQRLVGGFVQTLSARKASSLCFWLCVGWGAHSNFRLKFFTSAPAFAGSLPSPACACRLCWPGTCGCFGHTPSLPLVHTDYGQSGTHGELSNPCWLSHLSHLPFSPQLDHWSIACPQEDWKLKMVELLALLTELPLTMADLTKNMPNRVFWKQQQAAGFHSLPHLVEISHWQSWGGANGSDLREDHHRLMLFLPKVLQFSWTNACFLSLLYAFCQFLESWNGYFYNLFPAVQLLLGRRICQPPHSVMLEVSLSTTLNTLL